jgi:hypothetical protein
MSRQIGVGTALIVVTIFVAVVGGISYSRYSSHRAHQQLLQLRAALGLGSTQSDVEGILKSGKYRDLTLARESPSRWFVTTPYEFGATNWCLLLTFVNESLDEISVRSTDVYTRRPDGAPPDRRRQ